MFGVAVASLQNASEAEKERYQALYCGLCFALKNEYGQFSRAALNYDLAFMVMFLDSLYEPSEETGRSHCISHPRKKVPYAISEFSSYCAGLSVALAYHKCLDDIADDASRKARVAQAALSKAYAQAQAALPVHCEVIAETMQTIAAIEREPDASPDAASIAFGDMLGFLFECVPGHYPDIWANQLRDFGYWLGRFVYMMDAAIDFRQDAESGSYNPFVLMVARSQKRAKAPDTSARFSSLSPKPDPAAMRDILAVLAGRACETFERLPLIQDASLMDCVLYSGIWQKFNQEYESPQKPTSERQSSHANV